MRYQTAEGYKALKEHQKSRRNIEINKESEDGLRWIENIGTGWRFVGYADQLARIDHTGWFTSEDNLRDETFRGVVYKLPSRKSGPVYFVGYSDPYNKDAARGKVVTDCDDDTDAARDADHIAQIAAEKEREYNSAWQLGRQYADTFETVEHQRELRSKLFAELKTLKAANIEPDSTPTLCKTIKDKIASTRRNIKAAYSERKEIINDNWLRGPMVEAFADAAGLSAEEVKSIF